MPTKALIVIIPNLVSPLLGLLTINKEVLRYLRFGIALVTLVAAAFILDASAQEPLQKASFHWLAKPSVPALEIMLEIDKIKAVTFLMVSVILFFTAGLNIAFPKSAGVESSSKQIAIIGAFCAIMSANAFTFFFGLFCFLMALMIVVLSNQSDSESRANAGWRGLVSFVFFLELLFGAYLFASGHGSDMHFKAGSEAGGSSASALSIGLIFSTLMLMSFQSPYFQLARFFMQHWNATFPVLASLVLVVLPLFLSKSQGLLSQVTSRSEVLLLVPAIHLFVISVSTLSKRDSVSLLFYFVSLAASNVFLQNLTGNPLVAVLSGVIAAIMATALYFAVRFEQDESRKLKWAWLVLAAVFSAAPIFSTAWIGKQLYWSLIEPSLELRFLPLFALISKIFADLVLAIVFWQKVYERFETEKAAPQNMADYWFAGGIFVFSLSVFCCGKFFSGFADSIDVAGIEVFRWTNDLVQNHTAISSRIPEASDFFVEVAVVFPGIAGLLLVSFFLAHRERREKFKDWLSEVFRSLGSVGAFEKWLWERFFAKHLQQAVRLLFFIESKIESAVLRALTTKNFTGLARLSTRLDGSLFEKLSSHRPAWIISTLAGASKKIHTGNIQTYIIFALGLFLALISRMVVR